MTWASCTAYPLAPPSQEATYLGTAKGPVKQRVLAVTSPQSRAESMAYLITKISLSSVQFSCSVMSDSLRPHELQHARPTCPSPTPRVYPNSCPSSRWCHPAISSSVIPFSSCPHPFQHQGLFQWVNSSHEVAKVLESQLSISPSNEHPGLISFRMDWLNLLAVQRTPKSLLQHYSSKASILRCSAFFTVQLPHTYMTTVKTISLTRQTFVGKVMSLPFNMLSR